MEKVRLFNSKEDLDVVRKWPKKISEIQETTVDLVNAPDLEKKLIMVSLENLSQGKPYSETSIFDYSKINLSVKKYLSSVETVNSYIVPDQMLFFGGENNKIPEYYVNDVAKSIKCIRQLLPTKEIEQEEVSEKIKGVNEWKLMIKTTGKKNVVVISPVDEIFDGKYLGDIFSKEGLEKYLEACQIFLLISAANKQSVYDNKKITSYLVKLFGDMEISGLDWYLYQNIKRKNVFAKNDDKSLENELYNPSFLRLFDPNNRESKYFSPILSEVNRVYGSTKGEEIPIVLSLSSFMNHKIYSYFFGISPKDSFRAISLYKSEVEKICGVMPDFKRHLPKEIRILSIPFNGENLLGLSVDDFQFKYNFIFLRQRYDDFGDRETIRHEMVHQYIGEKYKPIDNLYISEGIAEYFGKYLGNIPNETFSKLVSEILKYKSHLKDLNPNNFVYIVGPVFISYIVSKYGEKYLYNFLKKNSCQSKHCRVSIDDVVDERVLSNGDKFYLNHVDDFLKYLEDYKKNSKNI